MKKPKVYLTRKIPKAIEILQGSCEVTVHNSTNAPSKKEIISKIKDKDGLLCILSDKIDGEVIASAKNLKVISSFSVGYDHIDIDAATKRGIYVAYTPEVLTETTADLAFALMLSVARRIVEGDRLVRRGKWKGNWSYEFMLGYDAHNKTLGIIGLGRIGSALARRTNGFKMKVLYYRRNRLSVEKEKELNVEYRELDKLLRESDFVSINLALDKDTYHLIDETKLKLMKNSSFLINTARGQVVDEKALVKALRNKWIAGAALDVFEKEPLPKNSPLLKFDNVVLVPHIGSASRETRDKMAEVAAINLLNVLKGEKPLYAVNLI
ncbi:MAG: 2-hydroxyacid dehydrogenase [Nitrososphaerales archaeon]